MFCNFEISNKLKDAGFNNYCDYVYKNNDNKLMPMTVSNISGWENVHGALNEQLPKGYISAPEYQDAIKWLVNDKNIFVTTEPEGALFYVYIYIKKNNNWDIHTNVWVKELQSGYSDPFKAIEAGLTYISEELI